MIFDDSGTKSGRRRGERPNPLLMGWMKKGAIGWKVNKTWMVWMIGRYVACTLCVWDMKG